MNDEIPFRQSSLVSHFSFRGPPFKFFYVSDPLSVVRTVLSRIRMIFLRVVVSPSDRVMRKEFQRFLGLRVVVSRSDIYAERIPTISTSSTNRSAAITSQKSLSLSGKSYMTTYDWTTMYGINEDIRRTTVERCGTRRRPKTSLGGWVW